MPILQYETRISPEGYITLPPMPEYRSRKVVVYVDEERDESEGKFSARSKIAERTPEERKADFEDFMESWAGCLKGMPHMTKEEIRAERRERKYGHLFKENERGEE